MNSIQNNEKYEDEVNIYKFPDDSGVYKHKRLSLEYCKEIRAKNGGTYTDEEVKGIREFIEIMAFLDCRFFTEQVMNWPPEKQIKALEARLKELNDPEMIRGTTNG